jgi:hypothetical protein
MHSSMPKMSMDGSEEYVLWNARAKIKNNKNEVNQALLIIRRE